MFIETPNRHAFRRRLWGLAIAATIWVIGAHVCFSHQTIPVIIWFAEILFLIVANPIP